MGKRKCVWCGEEIRGYPHVTLWEEDGEKSIGVRFHTLGELVLYITKVK